MKELHYEAQMMSVRIENIKYVLGELLGEYLQCGGNKSKELVFEASRAIAESSNIIDSVIELQESYRRSPEGVAAYGMKCSVCSQRFADSDFDVRSKRCNKCAEVEAVWPA